MEGVPVLFCDEPWYCVCDPPSIIVAKLPFMVDAEHLYRAVERGGKTVKPYQAPSLKKAPGIVLHAPLKF